MPTGRQFAPRPTIDRPATTYETQGKEIERLNSVYVNLLKGAGVDYIEGRCDAATWSLRGPMSYIECGIYHTTSLGLQLTAAASLRASARPQGPFGGCAHRGGHRRRRVQAHAARQEHPRRDRCAGGWRGGWGSGGGAPPERGWLCSVHAGRRSPRPLPPPAHPATAAHTCPASLPVTSPKNCPQAATPPGWTSPAQSMRSPLTRRWRSTACRQRGAPSSSSARGERRCGVPKRGAGAPAGPAVGCERAPAERRRARGSGGSCLRAARLGT